MLRVIGKMKTLMGSLYKMEIIAIGDLGGSTGTKINSYTLLDMAITDTGDANLLNQLKLKVGGSLISSGPSGSIGDNTVYSNLAVNPWSEVGFTDTASIAMLVDAGLAIGPGLFNGASGMIGPNGLFPTNNYMNFMAPSDGALYIHMSPNAADLDGSYTSQEYTTGRLYIFDFNGRGKLWVFITIDCEIFFFHNVSSFTPFIGKIAAKTRSVTHIASIEKLHLYLVRSKVTTAKGTIEDAAGNPASNCLVYIYKRATGQMVGKATSDVNGNYEAFCSAKKGDQVFMVCLDDDIAPDFEGIIYDRITV